VTVQHWLYFNILQIWSFGVLRIWTACRHPGCQCWLCISL